MVSTEIITGILSALGIVFTPAGFAAWFYLRKQERRLKTAEAFEKEVSALEQTIKTLQQQVAWHEERLNENQRAIAMRDADVERLRAEKNIIEIKNYKNKSAINSAYNCGFCSDARQCPVLIQRSKHEEEYKQQIENSHVDSNSK